MPSAALVPLLLQGTQSPQFAIYVGGLFVTFSVPIDTVRIVEAQPGDVSTCSFTIEDTTAAIPVPAAGSEVAIVNVANGDPLFVGFLNDYRVRPHGIGRDIEVQAFGIESVLDWYVSPSFFINAWSPTSTVCTLIAWVAAQMFGPAAVIAPEPNFTDAAIRDGNATWPIGSLNNGAVTFETVPTNTINAGSFRAFIQAMSRYNERSNLNVPLLATVDFYRRLRVCELGRRPADYTDLTVSDTPSSSLVAGSLEYEVHPGDVVRAIYIVGGNAAGSGWYTDGTGIRGRQAVVTDSSSTTAQLASDIATSYFATQNTLVRGSLTLEDYTPPAPNTIHPGSYLTLTDSQVSLVAQTYVISSIEKLLNGAGLQEWRVHFGGRPPSAVETLRKQYQASSSWQTAQA